VKGGHVAFHQQLTLLSEFTAADCRVRSLQQPQHPQHGLLQLLMMELLWESFCILICFWRLFIDRYLCRTRCLPGDSTLLLLLLPLLCVLCAAAYASLGEGLDLDALEDAARAVTSSRRREELTRKREVDDLEDDQSRGSHKLAGWPDPVARRMQSCMPLRLYLYQQSAQVCGNQQGWISLHSLQFGGPSPWPHYLSCQPCK